MKEYFRISMNNILYRLRPKKLLLGFFLAFVALLLHYMPSKITNTDAFFFSLSNLFYCIAIPIIMCYSYGKGFSLPKIFKVCSFIIAFILSQFIILGNFYSFADSFNIFHSIDLSFLIWILQSIFWTCIWYPIVKRVVWWFENYNLQDIPRQSETVNYKILFFVAILVRLIFFVSFYPGLFDYDAAFGLRTMLCPGEVISNHHPYFIQLIHKGFYKMGLIYFDRPDVGMAFLTIVWIIISSCIIVYAIKVLDSLIANKKVSTIIGYIFVLFPLFPLLSVYITKDGFFAYSFLLYTSCLLQLYVSKGSCIKKRSFIILFFTSMILVCFTRSQGFYIIVVESIYLIYIYRRFFLYIISVCIIPIALHLYISLIYFPSIKVESDSKKEVCCMLFQQTARYLKTYPEDVTKEELESIKVILNPDSIVAVYRPSICDPVKRFYIYGRTNTIKLDSLQHWSRWNHQGESKAIGNYIKAWFTMLFKHPNAYIDAQLSVIWPFFYSGGCSLYPIEMYWDSTSATNTNYSFYHMTFIGSKFSEVVSFLKNRPISDIFFGVFAYIWVSLFLISLLIWRRDWNGLSVFLPMLFSLFLLCLCPVSTARYIYPIIIIIPILFVYLLKIKTNHNVVLQEISGINPLL